MSLALDDTLSPFKRPEFSFQIPTIGKQAMDLLMDDDGGSFFGKGINATFEEGPSSASAHEPLTLSQLTPGPKILRSPSPAKHTARSPSDAIDDKNALPSHPGDQLSDGSPPGYSGQPASFSNLLTEIEALVVDAQAPGHRATSPPVARADPIGPALESIEEETKHSKHATDAVEPESTPDRVEPTEVNSSVAVVSGTVTQIVPEHDQQVKPNSVSPISPDSYSIQRVPDLRSYLARAGCHWCKGLESDQVQTNPGDV